MKMVGFFALLGLCIVVFSVGYRFTVGFSSQKPSDYADTGPKFDIRTHLGGHLLAEGIIYGPTGKASTRFVADMNGTWDGDKGTLAESFRYLDGGALQREWALVMGENGHFTATADDIVGVATGEQSGSTVRMKYKIRLAEDAGGHVLSVTDWLYLLEDGTIMNKSEMRKFGVKVAELVATMRPVKE